MLNLDNADAERMRQIENDVARALAPYRSNTEAALAVFACVRIAKTLLQRYPERTREQLVPVIVAYLAGDAAQSTEGDFLLLPN